MKLSCKGQNLRETGQREGGGRRGGRKGKKNRGEAKNDLDRLTQELTIFAALLSSTLNTIGHASILQAKQGGGGGERGEKVE